MSWNAAGALAARLYNFALILPWTEFVSWLIIATTPAKAGAPTEVPPTTVKPPALDRNPVTDGRLAGISTARPRVAIRLDALSQSAAPVSPLDPMIVIPCALACFPIAATRAASCGVKFCSHEP